MSKEAKPLNGIVVSPQWHNQSIKSITAVVLLQVLGVKVVLGTALLFETKEECV